MVRRVTACLALIAASYTVPSFGFAGLQGAIRRQRGHALSMPGRARSAAPASALSVACQLPRDAQEQCAAAGCAPNAAYAADGDSAGARSATRPLLLKDPANVARATMLGVAAMYGTNFGSVKILEEAMPSSVAAATRFTLASLALLPLLKGLEREVLLPSLEVGMLTALGYFAQGLSLSVSSSNASTAAFLCSLAVVVCPLLDLMQGTRALACSEVLAIALAVAGTAVLELSGAAPNKSDLWAMMQPLAFGTAFWKVEQLMHKFPHQANPITFIQVAVVALFSLGWAVADLAGGGAGLSGIATAGAALADALQSDPRLPAALLWTSLFTTALTVWLETKALGALSSAETTLLFSTEPLWAAAFAHAVLGEHLGANVLIGGALIIAACVSRTAADVVDGEPRAEASKLAGVAQRGRADAERAVEGCVQGSWAPSYDRRDKAKREQFQLARLGSLLALADWSAEAYPSEGMHSAAVAEASAATLARLASSSAASDLMDGAVLVGAVMHETHALLL